MFVTEEEMKKTRLNLAHQMHEYIMNTGNEDIYEIWNRDYMPDNPSEEDFELYANDPSEFAYLCSGFALLEDY